MAGFNCGDLLSLAQRSTPNVSKFQTRQTRRFRLFCSLWQKINEVRGEIFNSSQPRAINCLSLTIKVFISTFNCQTAFDSEQKKSV